MKFIVIENQQFSIEKKSETNELYNFQLISLIKLLSYIFKWEKVTLAQFP